MLSNVKILVLLDKYIRLVQDLEEYFPSTSDDFMFFINVSVSFMYFEYDNNGSLPPDLLLLYQNTLGQLATNYLGNGGLSKEFSESIIIFLLRTYFIHYSITDDLFSLLCVIIQSAFEQRDENIVQMLTCMFGKMKY